MKIALYYRKPFEIGGVEKTILERGKLLKELGNDITFIFSEVGKNTNILELWSEVGRVINQKYINEFFDLVIYDSIYLNKIIPAKEYIQVINGNVIDAGDMLSNNISIDKYISVSKDTQKQFKEKFGIDSVIIPNIICKDIQELANEKFELKKKKYNFVIVSRIDPQKGFERVAEFVKRLHAKTQDYQIVVVGSNDNYPKYAEELRNRLSKYNIIWEGLQNNPYKYIKNADYLIQLSDYESQCMVMYESLILRNSSYCYGL